MSAPARTVVPAEEALAAVALIRAYTARDMYTADRILDRWATKGQGRQLCRRGGQLGRRDPHPRGRGRQGRRSSRGGRGPGGLPENHGREGGRLTVVSGFICT